MDCFQVFVLVSQAKAGLLIEHWTTPPIDKEQGENTTGENESVVCVQLRGYADRLDINNAAEGETSVIHAIELANPSNPPRQGLPF